MEPESPGRLELERWEASRPRNLYDATPNLARVLRNHLGAAGLRGIEPELRSFGAVVAEVVGPAVRTLEHHPPTLTRDDGIGRRIDEIEFHPAYRDAGSAVWASGIVPADAFKQAALLYLLTHVGEGGHACPVVCSAGLVRALRRHGSEDLRSRFLPPLLEIDYGRCQRGAQFLTEVQGGSDVGANETAAQPAGDGAWMISGEKWFCSVADADQFVITARTTDAPGTRALGCFLVPRRLPDGKLNGFRIRRLKDKLGTRALASAEIEFEGALGWPIGAVDDGFRIAVGVVLNTSRWLNALGSAGIMRGACLEATAFASHRTAFAHTIGSYPLVRENLAVMKAEEQAALASCMWLTSIVERMDQGVAEPQDVAIHRVLVNANKYVTSIAATDVVHRAIEILGGNGTIEDFSPLPRLYRDAIVFESWEGTHNVLCEQVRRDIARLGLLEPVSVELRARLQALAEGDHAAEAWKISASLDVVEPALRGAGTQDRSVPFRRCLGRFMRIAQATAMLEMAEGTDSEQACAAALFVRRHLVAGDDPTADAVATQLADRVIGADLG